MLRRLLILASFVLLAACSKKPELPPLTGSAPVLAFGDSLTYGTGASADEAYPAQLSKQINHAVINAGVPGETTAQGLARLAATLETHRPQLVLLCLGGNDFLQKLPESETRANLQAMLDMLKARRTPVLLIAVPTPGLSVSNHRLYAELAKENGVPLEDEALSDILGKSALKSDTVHPNAAGYQQFATALLARLQAAGAVRD